MNVIRSRQSQNEAEEVANAIDKSLVDCSNQATDTGAFRESSSSILARAAFRSIIFSCSASTWAARVCCFLRISCKLRLEQTGKLTTLSCNSASLNIE